MARASGGRTRGQGRKAASRPAASRSRPRRPAPPAESEPPELPALPAPDVEAPPEHPLPPAPLSEPEAAFAARFVPPPPERPRPVARRAIFLDVENTSRPQHLAHVIDHLNIERQDYQTELVAVANWKVVSQESARLLAQRGALLVHSAPSTGVRDWSDLRIAVGAGIWLAAARPGDTIQIVSDDRAFDAVGDVAASLGIDFYRLSYRRLVKDEAPELAPPPPPAPRAEGAAGGSRRRRRRGGRGRSGGRGAPGGEARGRPSAPPMRPPAPPVERREVAPAAGGELAHTAPHDELVSVVRELVARAATGSVSIDTLANALKSRGFRRPPGSPRLLTRLRRIREITVGPNGMVTLVDARPGAMAAPEPSGIGPTGEREAREDWSREPVEFAAAEPSELLDGSGAPTEEPVAGDAQPATPGGGRRRRRRRWRGGRRRPSPAPSA